MRLRTSLLLALTALSFACAHEPRLRNPPKRRATKAQLDVAMRTGLVIGEFPMEGSSSVVDGDTIEVGNLDASMRLLGLDTEETFKKAEERRGYELGMEKYCKLMRGDSLRPVKMATPLGEEAKNFAKKYFEGVTRVRLERDHPGEIRDYYGRYLAYVFVEKNGKWENYALAAVRAGMSPYYPKYGRSRRFHEQFVEAQRLARQEQLGIWNPKGETCHDYDERLAWWNSRGDAIHAFEQKMEQAPDEYIALTRWDALRKIEKRIGQQVVVLASVGEIRLGDRGPSIVKLNRTRGTSLELIFWDKDILAASGIAGMLGEYVQVRGIVSKYVDKDRGYEKLQIQVSLPGQVNEPGQSEALPTAGVAPTKDLLPSDAVMDDAFPEDMQFDAEDLK